MRCLHPKVLLGCLNRNVAQQELNLLQFSSGRVAELGTGPPEVVWREGRDADFLRELPDYMPDDLFRHTFSPDSSGPADPTE